MQNKLRIIKFKSQDTNQNRSKRKNGKSKNFLCIKIKIRLSVIEHCYVNL